MMNYIEQNQQKNQVDAQEYTHKKPNPGNTDIFGIRYFLFYQLLIGEPSFMDVEQIDWKLNDHAEPEYTRTPRPMTIQIANQWISGGKSF